MSASWKDYALCAQADPDAWFPEKGKNCAAVRRICFRCPVRAQCLNYGLDEEHGIWGGLTRDERRRLRQEEKAA